MSGRREAAIGLGCYGAYLAVRGLVWHPRGRARAADNAARIAALERDLGLDLEPAVQARAGRHQRLVQVLNVGYAAGNVMLSVGWLIALQRRGDPRFARERSAAVAAFLGALPVFLAFPTAPPRSIDHVTDTLLEAGIDLDHPMLTRFYNPIAAMPSHHVALAVVTGVGLGASHPSPVGRWLWRSYPGAVAAVVVGTGNHFVLDVLAGAALGGVARWLTR